MVLKCLGWMYLADHRKEKLLLLIHDSSSQLLPLYLQQSIATFNNPGRDARVRRPRQFIIPEHMSQHMRRSPLAQAVTS
jgi:hypothetical protein